MVRSIGPIILTV